VEQMMEQILERLLATQEKIKADQNTHMKKMGAKIDANMKANKEERKAEMK
jgi:hypothetical protein